MYRLNEQECDEPISENIAEKQENWIVEPALARLGAFGGDAKTYLFLPTSKGYF